MGHFKSDHNKRKADHNKSDYINGILNAMSKTSAMFHLNCLIYQSSIIR